MSLLKIHWIIILNWWGTHTHTRTLQLSHWFCTPTSSTLTFRLLKRYVQPPSIGWLSELIAECSCKWFTHCGAAWHSVWSLPGRHTIQHDCCGLPSPSVMTWIDMRQRLLYSVIEESTESLERKLDSLWIGKEEELSWNLPHLSIEDTPEIE